MIGCGIKMELSRTKKGARNAVFNVSGVILNILCSFIIRTVFIYTLGKAYLGINGLFTNILSFLSLAEMGIGTSIIYCLYKPVAENDIKKIKELMNFYKTAYRYIAIVVAVTGILIMPFLEWLIYDKPDIPESLYVIYGLYLFNSVSSYFFIYKKSLLIAYQKEYIVSIINIVYYVVMNGLQVVALILFKNFFAYLIIQILSNVVNNIVVSLICDKKYPYIIDNKEKLGKEEKNRIFDDVKALIIYRVASIILNSTDNLVISKGVGLIEVGLYSNYYLVTRAVYNLIRQAISAMTASIGNLNVTQDKDRQELVFRATTFLASLLYGIAAIIFYVVLDKFMVLWLDETYLFDRKIVIIIVINFYLTGMSGIYNILRATFGLFVQGRMRPLLSSIINIVLSVALVKPLGVFGVFIGTAIALISINFWYDPYIVYKCALKRDYKMFLINNIIYAVSYIVIAICCEKICGFVSFGNAWAELIVDAVLTGIIAVIIVVLLFWKKQEMKFLLNKIKSILKRNK